MEGLQKLGTQILLVTVAAASALFAQSSAPETPQNHASVADTLQIVGPPGGATPPSWQARDHYTYTARDEDRHLHSIGQVQAENVAVPRLIAGNGAPSVSVSPGS